VLLGYILAGMKVLNILIVDDELNIRKTIAYCLAAEGHTVITVGRSSEALEEAAQQSFDLAFLDLKLGNENGMDLVPELIARTPWIKIVIITAHASIRSAVEAVKKGASDYMEKPFTPDQILLVTSRMQQLLTMEMELFSLKEIQDDSGPNLLLESRSPSMRAALDTLKKAAGSQAILLLTGESGTGKSVLAKAVHHWSSRSQRPFAVVSCPSIPSELLESELFGHTRGSFTGAVKNNPGRLSLCDGGTLLLDEIADMPVAVQAKLLQFIQDKTYQRVGDPVSRRADVRIIAATNGSLEERIQAGTFREDLYYRLNVISVAIPPLRDHKEDILPLAREFLSYYCRVNHRTACTLSEKDAARLTSYSWPGNIRELRNTIERAVILGDERTLDAEIIPPLSDESGKEESFPALGDQATLEQIESIHIRRVIARSATLQEAAATLGIDQATLWRKRRSYHIS
jgi:two-component system, NtrC family, response regulator AlgB